MPLARHRRRVAYPVHRRALAVLELPQDEVVLQAIGADGQIVAVGLEVEQDAGALVDAPRNAFEAYADLALAEVLNVACDRVREVRIGLNTVEKFGIAVAVDGARLVGDAGRRLALLPLPPVDRQHLLVSVLLDAPDPHHGNE